MRPARAAGSPHGNKARWCPLQRPIAHRRRELSSGLLPARLPSGFAARLERGCAERNERALARECVAR